MTNREIERNREREKDHIARGNTYIISFPNCDRCHDYMPLLDARDMQLSHQNHTMMGVVISIFVHGSDPHGYIEVVGTIDLIRGCVPLTHAQTQALNLMTCTIRKHQEQLIV